MARCVFLYSSAQKVQNFLARFTVDGAGSPRYTFTLCKAENSGQKARCLFVYKTRKGSSDTKYIFQFGRILAFCFLGEVLHVVLPLPVPASVYGLVLLLVPAGSSSQELKTTALAVSLATRAMGNVAFLLYDRALHNLQQVYQLVWRPKLHKMLGKR